MHSGGILNLLRNTDLMLFELHEFGGLVDVARVF